MDIATINYIVGQVVFGKLKGYPPWPAVITALPNNKKVARIMYFNSGQYSELSFKKLTPYHSAAAIIQRHLNRNVGFTKAYHEMELVAEANKRKEAPDGRIKKKVKKPVKKQTHQVPLLIIKILSKDEILKIQMDLKGKKNIGRNIADRCY